MSDMIERVARALQDAQGVGLDPFTSKLAARAAIEAMREPTSRMTEVGCMASNATMDDSWRAMIDDALA